MVCSRLGSGAVVLFVVPDPKREQTIAQWAQEEAQELNSPADIFWVTTLHKVRTASLTSSPIWTVPGRGVHSLLEMSSAGADSDCKLDFLEGHVFADGLLN